VRPLSYERARKKLSDSLFLTLWYVTRYFILPDLGTKTVQVPPDLIAEIEAEAVRPQLLAFRHKSFPKQAV